MIWFQMDEQRLNWYKYAFIYRERGKNYEWLMDPRTGITRVNNTTGISLILTTSKEM